jgi:hypothetical protein
VNSQSSWYWSLENPGHIHELPLHYEKIGVWCGLSASRVIVLIVYDGTVNAVMREQHPVVIFHSANTRSKAIRFFPARFSSTWYGTCKFCSAIMAFDGIL